MCFSDALTLAIDSTALVAEMLTASARHMVAPLSALNPEVAVRALLVLFALDELEECFVTCSYVIRNLILLAGLSSVIVDAAVQAIVLLASGAVELRIILLLLGIENKRKPAVGGRTPRDVLLILDGLVEREAAILVVLLVIKQVLQIGVADLMLALRVRTDDRNLCFFDLQSQVLAETVPVEDMLAELQREDAVFVFELFDADLAIELIHLLFLLLVPELFKLVLFFHLE